MAAADVLTQRLNIHGVCFSELCGQHLSKSIVSGEARIMGRQIPPGFSLNHIFETTADDVTLPRGEPDIGSRQYQLRHCYIPPVTNCVIGPQAQVKRPATGISGDKVRLSGITRRGNVPNGIVASGSDGGSLVALALKKGRVDVAEFLESLGLE